jgi:hypothetical protein
VIPEEQKPLELEEGGRILRKISKKSGLRLWAALIYLILGTSHLSGNELCRNVNCNKLTFSIKGLEFIY